MDLFTSKDYTYSMKNRSLLVKKTEWFYEDVSNKRKDLKKMHVQTDNEFEQNRLKKSR